MQRVRGAKPSAQITSLERELADLEKRIEQQKKGSVDLIEYDCGKIIKHIEEKEKELKELEDELEKQRKITAEKKKNQSKDVTQLEDQINELRRTTKKQ